MKIIVTAELDLLSTDYWLNEEDFEFIGEAGIIDLVKEDLDSFLDDATWKVQVIR